jgi:hypothetical protein
MDTKTPKKTAEPKKAKPKKVVKIVTPEEEDPLLRPMAPGTVKIEHGTFLVKW